MQNISTLGFLNDLLEFFENLLEFFSGLSFFGLEFFLNVQKKPVTTYTELFTQKKNPYCVDHKKISKGGNSLVVWGENNLSPCLPLAPAKAAKGNCMGVTVVGEDDVIGTENKSILVQSFAFLCPYETSFLTQFPFVSTHANRVGLCEVSIGVNKETKLLMRLFINKIISLRIG